MRFKTTNNKTTLPTVRAERLRIDLNKRHFWFEKRNALEKSIDLSQIKLNYRQV